MLKNPHTKNIHKSRGFHCTSTCTMYAYCITDAYLIWLVSELLEKVTSPVSTTKLSSSIAILENSVLPPTEFLWRGNISPHPSGVPEKKLAWAL